MGRNYVPAVALCPAESGLEDLRFCRIPEHVKMWGIKVNYCVRVKMYIWMLPRAKDTVQTTEA